MLQKQMCWHTRRDKISNEDIHEKGVQPWWMTFMGGVAKMVRVCKGEVHGCPNQRCEKMALRMIWRSKGRLKKYWGEIIKQDMT